MRGRTQPCSKPKAQQRNYKWFMLYAETPEDRENARQSYIALSNAINDK